MAHSVDWVIIGLGNVGRQYEGSRHNIGFEVVDLVASRHKLVFAPGKGDFYQALPGKMENSSSEARIGVLSWLRKLFGGQSTNSGAESAELKAAFHCALLKPTTLMNRSGIAARQALELCSVAPQQLIVIVDDFQLPLGRVRFRKSGSDGGHNGLKSIITELGTEDFPRLRVGIGPKPSNSNIVEFVLGQFVTSEEPIKVEAVGRAADACDSINAIKDYTAASQANTSVNQLDIIASKYNTIA